MTIKELWKKFIDGDKDGKETEFLPSILEVTETPPSPVGRLVLWTIVILLVAGSLWAWFGEVDEVATASGKIIPVGQVKLVQSGNKGVIKELYVKEGDVVEEGQPLVQLDTTKTKADVDQLKKQVAYYKLTVDRLNCEITGKLFSPEKSEDLNPEDINAQQALYQSRQSQIASQTTKTNMGIQQDEAAIRSALAAQDKYQSLMAIAQEKEDRLQSLLDSDSVALFQLLEQRASRIEYQKNLQAQTSEIERAQGKLAEAESDLAAIQANYHKDIMTELVEARKQHNAYAEELKKAQETDRLSIITAPASGRVNQLALHTVGGVVTEGQSLMMIVPEDAVLEVEAWADNKDIGFIEVGQKAEVKIETFDFQKFGIIDGEVMEISPDAVTDNADKEKNNKFRLALRLSTNQVTVGSREVRLSPGMKTTAEIKIRQKRIIDFFLDPFRKYKDEALRER